MLFAASYLGIPGRPAYHHRLRGRSGCRAAGIGGAMGVAKNVMIAWIVTIPASAAVAATFYWIIAGFAFQALLAIDVLAMLGFGGSVARV